PQQRPPRDFRPPCREERRRRLGMAVRSGTAVAARYGAISRGDLGLRRSAPDLVARARRMGDRLHRVQSSWPARIARDDARLPHGSQAGSRDAPRGQGRRLALAPLRWAMGDDPSTIAVAWRRTHVALVLTRPAALGRSHAVARGA